MFRIHAFAVSTCLLVACGGEPSPASGKAEAAKQPEPAKQPDPQPAAEPAPEPKPKPAFMNEPERLSPKGEPWADHERRTIDTTGLARRGPESARVVMLACVDMVDPFVKRGQKQLAESVAAFPDDVAVHLRPYWNLVESFEEAAKRGDKDAIARRELTERVARALVAAEQQGKLWELHDRLLEADKDQLTADGLGKLAGEAGLDVEAWKAALDSEQTKTAVAAHKQACQALGVDRAVPAYFINGRRVLGAIPADAFRYLIEVELHGGFEALPK